MKLSNKTKYYAVDSSVTILDIIGEMYAAASVQPAV